MSLTRRNLFQDKTRLALSIGGVGLAVALILILKGFLAGMNRQITSYLYHSPGTIVIAKEDIINLLGTVSLIPDGTKHKAENILGVDPVVPIFSQFVILDLHEKKQPAYMIGYDPGEGGGPWQLVVGREPSSKEEMLFDRVLADRYGLRIGDQVMMHEGMDGKHDFGIHLKTNDPANPDFLVQVLSDWGP